MAPTTNKTPTAGTTTSGRQSRRPRRYEPEFGSSSRISKPEPKPVPGPVKLTPSEEKKLQDRLLKEDFPHIAARSKAGKAAAAGSSLPSPQSSDDGAPGRAPKEAPRKKIRFVIKKRDQGKEKEVITPTEPQCVVKSCSMCIKYGDTCVNDGCPTCDCKLCETCICKSCVAFHRRMGNRTELDRLRKEGDKESEGYRERCLKVVEERTESEDWLREACERKACREGGIWSRSEIEAAEALVMLSRS